MAAALISDRPGISVDLFPGNLPNVVIGVFEYRKCCDFWRQQMNHQPANDGSSQKLEMRWKIQVVTASTFPTSLHTDATKPIKRVPRQMSCRSASGSSGRVPQ